jgi:hypothetical protein
MMSASHQGPKPNRLGPNPPKPGGDTMPKQITWQTAIFALIGLVAIATVGLNSHAESRAIAASSAEVDPADCNIRDPLSACYEIKLGYPAGDLWVTEDFF